MMPSRALPAEKRRRAGSFLLLGALLLGYAAIYLLEDVDDGAPSSAVQRSLQLEEAASRAASARALAKNAASPPAADEVPGEYIVKPWVGRAMRDLWERDWKVGLELAGAAASSKLSGAHRAINVLDGSNATRWASRPDKGEVQGEEWVTFDMGGPVSVARVSIDWHEEAYAEDYKMQVAYEKENCLPDGTPCPDSWTTVVDVTGKADANSTYDEIDDEDHALQGVRYLRLVLSQRAPGQDSFSIYSLEVYRKQMVVGEVQTGISCGSTMTAVTSSLLSKHGGTLIQSYENAEFFAASMTEAQKDDMSEDPCVFTVEPNYVVRARGRNRKRPGGGAPGPVGDEEEHRKLAIPEFNRQDENPQNWGLERISSMGARNGRYKWVHEGFDTHIYIFDSGIYPDHSDFLKEYDQSSRIGDGLICAGTSLDYQTNDHGTHVASLAAGWYHGTAKAAIVHPIQVLDANGEGTTASVLCGMERLLQDGKDFNAANAPKKIRAVVNLSLGVNGRSDALDKVVYDMTQVGYTVVIAAGDHDGNACFYSPYDPTAITVGALKDAYDGRNDKTATSNYGECIDIWAPGEDIVGASGAGEYEQVSASGTSVAAPFVAGVAALFFEDVNTAQYNTNELAATVKEKVVNNGEIGILGDIGYGSVNKIVQTTASKCATDEHCGIGLRCLDDGVCWALSKSLSELKSARVAAASQEVACSENFPVCPGKDPGEYCDGTGDCGGPFCACEVGEEFCGGGPNPC